MTTRAVAPEYVLVIAIRNSAINVYVLDRPCMPAGELTVRAPVTSSLDRFPACPHGASAMQESSLPLLVLSVRLHHRYFCERSYRAHRKWLLGSGVRCISQNTPRQLDLSYLSSTMPLTHHGYTVHISSDGEELPQHSIDVGQSVVRCEISSRAGRVRICALDLLA